MQPIDRLIEMLRYCRPAGSRTEKAYITRFIAGLPGATQDAYRNWHVRVGDPAKDTILWSSHTDTVHWHEGMQKISINPHTGFAKLSKRSKRKGSNCLGADDTVGNWLMVEMISRGIPGHYIFHYGEERGCIGSNDLAEFRPEWVRQFRVAIALDRRGTEDIITHQGYGKSASDEFALSLADILNSAGPFDYRPSPHGIYTDTASYMDLIGECTNVSVGYSGEHGGEEFIDTCHAEFLLEALCAVRLDLLVVKREPGEVSDDGWDRRGQDYRYGDWHGLPSHYRWDADDYNEHLLSCSVYKDPRTCDCGAEAMARMAREERALAEMNDTPPCVPEDGLQPTAIRGVMYDPDADLYVVDDEDSTYLDKDYARVTAHLSAKREIQVTWACPIHGPHHDHQCPKCKADRLPTIQVNEAAMVPVKAKDTLLAERLRDGAEARRFLTPSEAKIVRQGQTMPVVRAWRKQKYNIRKPKRLRGGWALGPGGKEAR